MNSYSIDFSEYQTINNLWPNFVERVGLEKARIAINQALDLQKMHGKNNTIPVLLFETCGLALVNINLLYNQLGVFCNQEKMVLLISTSNKLLQILREN